MIGLMAPKLKWEVEERAIEAATKESKEFMKNIEFLLALTKKSRISKTLIKKQNGFEVVKDNLEEFEDAKERIANTWARAGRPALVGGWGAEN